MHAIIVIDLYYGLSMVQCSVVSAVFITYFMQEQEASKAVDIDGAKLLPDGLFVLWNWDWMEPCDGSDSERSVTSSPELLSGCHDTTEQETGESDLLSMLKHMVTFKCIGSSRDPDCQEVLAQASKTIKDGEHIDVKLCPEPGNKYDAKAIAFIIRLDNEWRRIGYVVHEVLDVVHDALGREEIVQVEMKWVKYLLHWSKSGPGWYTGIDITKMGDWSPVVLKHSSTI